MPTSGASARAAINGERKAAHKTAFVAAVQTRDDGRPLYMSLAPVSDFTNQEMAQWARSHLAPGCHVVSDGTPAFAQVRQVGAVHERHVTGPGRQGVQTSQLHWVNTTWSATSCSPLASTRPLPLKVLRASKISS